MRSSAVLYALGLALPLAAQTPPARPPQPSGPAFVLIKAGRLIDGRGGPVQTNVGILIEGERIRSVGPFAEVERRAQAARVVDLSTFTVLPGLIDTHTHMLLQGDITSAEYEEQLLKQSIPYRTILGARNARIALEHGITTIRDVETEGAMYADVDIKLAINRGEVVGSRVFASTRAMAPTGMYLVGSPNWGIELPKGVQMVDGVEPARLAVREQVSHGADWIKFYADRRYYWGPDSVVHSWANFTPDEAAAIVGEAKRLGRSTATHAVGADGIAAAVRAGAASIEHGHGMTDSLMDVLVRQGIHWVPTVTVGVYVAPGRGGIWPSLVEHERKAFGRAVKKGVKIAMGTDVGRFPWTGPQGIHQAKELEYYVQWGMTASQAIQSATLVAAELLGQAANLGTVTAGRFADIIAVSGDPLQDITELQRVKFVMKGEVVVVGP